MEKNSFRNPGMNFRGVTLWMLNDRLEKEKIVRQLHGIARAGWGAVICRTFNGLLTEYLGEEWMEIMDLVVAHAEGLGLRVWLQAGYMPSAIPGLEESRAHIGLTIKSKHEGINQNENILAHDSEYIYCTRVLTTVLDILNGEAVKDYLDDAYKKPWETPFRPHFGKTIEAIWVDEPHFRPPLLPWSHSLPSRFRNHWDYDITCLVPSLFRPVEDYQRIRHHYWRTVLAMFLEAYFTRVGQWCAEHDVKFSGHLMGEDTLNNQVGFTAATMPCYEFMQLPGIE